MPNIYYIVVTRVGVLIKCQPAKIADLATYSPVNISNIITEFRIKRHLLLKYSTSDVQFGAKYKTNKTTISLSNII